MKNDTDGVTSIENETEPMTLEEQLQRAIDKTLSEITTITTRSTNLLHDFKVFETKRKCTKKFGNSFIKHS